MLFDLSVIFHNAFSATYQQVPVRHAGHMTNSLDISKSVKWEIARAHTHTRIHRKYLVVQPQLKTSNATSSMQHTYIQSRLIIHNGELHNVWIHGLQKNNNKDLVGNY